MQSGKLRWFYKFNMDCGCGYFIAHQHAYARRARYCRGKSVSLSICPSHAVLYQKECIIVKLFPTSGSGMSDSSFLDAYHDYKIPRGIPSAGVLSKHLCPENL